MKISNDLVDFGNHTIFIDTETRGLYGEVVCIQIYCPKMDKDTVFLYESPDVEEILSYCQHAHWVGHNLIYDMTCLDFMPENWDDTFLAGRLVWYFLDSFSLDEFMKEALRYDPYEGMDKAKMQRSFEGKKFISMSAEQIKYAATDVFYLPPVWDKCKHKLDEMSYILDKLAVGYIFKFQKNGMPVLLDELKKRRKDIADEIKQINCPINVNSYHQVRPYIGSTDSGKEGLINEMYRGNLKAAEVYWVRKLRKQDSFIEKFLEPRIRGHFNVATKSGRFNCADQNLQQIPSSLKKYFGVKPESGRVLIYADFAQLELRSVCALINEKKLESLFRSGEDLHTFTAAGLNNKPLDKVTKDERQGAKIANFGLLYGAGINTFLGIWEEFIVTGFRSYTDLTNAVSGDLASRRPDFNLAKKTKQSWLKLYKDIDEWQQENIRRYNKYGEWKTGLGRPYKAKILTDFNNIQNSGTGAEVTKLSLHYLMQEIQEDSTVQLLNVIHDSFILESDIDKAQQHALTLAKSMNEAWYEVAKCLQIPDLPMPVQVFVGYNWGKIEDEHIYTLTYDKGVLNVSSFER